MCIVNVLLLRKYTVNLLTIVGVVSLLGCNPKSNVSTMNMLYAVQEKEKYGGMNYVYEAKKRVEHEKETE